MSNTDTDEVGGAEDSVRYDLAGNPLPSLPAAVRPVMPPPNAIPTQQFGGVIGQPNFTPPPGSSLGWSGAVTPVQNTASSGPALYAGLGIAAIVIFGLIFVLRAVKPNSVGAPTSYKTYTSLDNTFSCDQPAGWDHHETGAPGGVLSTVTFLNGKVRFKVISDAEGSLMSEGGQCRKCQSAGGTADPSGSEAAREGQASAGRQYPRLLRGEADDIHFKCRRFEGVRMG